MHVKRSMPAVLLALAGLVGASGAVEADVNVRHRLDVETTGGKVLVRVTIENHGEKTIWVPRGENQTAPSRVTLAETLVPRQPVIRSASASRNLLSVPLDGRDMPRFTRMR